MSAKVLVIGPASGKFEELLKKITALHAKNNFSFAVLVGDVFTVGGEADPALQKLLAGQLAVPLPTYFSAGPGDLPESLTARLQDGDGLEVCENLFFLGRKGQIKTSEGAIIQAIGPVESLDSEDMDNSLSMEDLESLKKGPSPHILFTWDWPALIAVNAKAQPTGTVPGGASGIAKICQSLKPRYHVSFSENFYEREPFFHPFNESENEERSITRFISMAPFGNGDGQKALYAFSLPIAGSTIEPENLTASPWLQRARPEKPKSDGNQNNYKFGTDDRRGRHGKKRRRGDNRGRSPPKQEDCFFCLSFRNLEKHLLVSIGDESYLAVAKGPLPTSSTFESLPCSAHILIIPLVHTSTIESIPDPFSRASTIKEMGRFLESLTKCFASRKLGTVCWRLNRRRLIHAHWQVLPFPTEMSAALVREAFVVQAGNDLLESSFEDKPFPSFSSEAEAEAGAEAENGDAVDGEYDDNESFSVLISSAPDEETGEIHQIHIRMQLEEGKPFAIQFGRQVMAKLLRLDDRIDWKDCGMTFDEESADTNSFKDIFKEFDFSLA